MKCGIVCVDIHYAAHGPVFQRAAHITVNTANSISECVELNMNLGILCAFFFFFFAFFVISNFVMTVGDNRRLQHFIKLVMIL